MLLKISKKKTDKQTGRQAGRVSEKEKEAYALEEKSKKASVRRNGFCLSEKKEKI